MSDTLVSVEQKTVLFYEDELTALRADDGHVYVAITQMCQALGIDTQAQTRRIRRLPVLSKGLKVVAKLATTFGDRDTYVLRVDLVPLWLSGIRTSAVNEAIRPKLERFQEEAAKVLWEAFQEGRLTAESGIDELVAAAPHSDAVQAYQMAQAIMRLARQQIIIEAQLSGRLDAHEFFLADHEQRLEDIEATLGDTGRNVTPDQASQISQAVKAVAVAAGKKSGRNEFGAVYGELYRKFGITSYKMLPARRFDEAMKFLTDWYQSLTDDELLF